MRFIKAVAANLVGTGIALAALFLFTMIIFGGIIARSTQKVQSVRSESILVVDIPAVIPEVVSGDPFAQAFGQESSFGLFDLTRAIERAAGDNRIKGLWIKSGALATPWASLQAVRRSISIFKASGKPVVASSPSFSMNEAGYFISSLADSVFADPHTMMEFNGIAMTVSFYADLFDRLDIHVDAVRAGTFKSALEPYTRTDLSDENREQLQRITDGIANTFVNAVAEDRGLTVSDIDGLMESHALMTASDALNAGLIDGIRYDDDIRSSLLETTGQELGETLRTTSIKSYVRDTPTNSNRGDSDVAVIYVVGTMMPGKSTDIPNPFLGGQTVGSDTFIRSIRKARLNKRTKAIVIRIDSPGGVVPAADAMLEEIRVAAREIPIIVSMGGVAASGGYWIATGAETIVAESLTITGSIGVFSLLIDTSEFMSNKIGITFDGVKSHPYADMMSGMRRLSAAETAMLQRTTDQVYESFLDLVAESRNLSIEDVDAVAQGRVWTGEDALAAGLIDEFGGLDDAIDIAAVAAGLPADEFRIRFYAAPKGFFARFTDPMVRAAAGWIISAAGYNPNTELAASLANLNEMMGYHGTVVARMPFDLQTH